MQKLYIIRHGFAGKKIEDEALDVERPLTKAGQKQIKKLAKSLKKLEVSFDRVLTSPLLRAKETAEIVNAACCDIKKVKVTDLLLPDSSSTHLIKFLNQKFKAANEVAIVGHEPFLSLFASFCLSKSKNSYVNLKKGGILMLEVDKVITPGGCRLSWLMEPKKKSK